VKHGTMAGPDMSPHRRALVVRVVVEALLTKRRLLDVVRDVSASTRYDAVPVWEGALYRLVRRVKWRKHLAIRPDVVRALYRAGWSRGVIYDETGVQPQSSDLL